MLFIIRIYRKATPDARSAMRWGAVAWTGSILSLIASGVAFAHDPAWGGTMGAISAIMTLAAASVTFMTGFAAGYEAASRGEPVEI